MSFATRLVRPRFAVALAFALTSAFAVGCTDDDNSNEACNGHGTLHGDHCDCDSGYARTADQLGCVLDTDMDEADVTEQDTGTGIRDASPTTSDAADTLSDTQDPDTSGGDVETVDPDAADTTLPDTDPIDATDATAPGDVSDVEPDTVDPTAQPLAFTATSTSGVTGQAQDGSQVWLLNATDGSVELRLESYASFGGVSAPGTVSLDAVETDYATCGTCLILQTECTPHGDHSHCNRTFMPEVGGEVRVDAIGPNAGDRLRGELLNVVFREVTIAGDYTTTTVVDGQRYALDPWAFDVALQPLGGSTGDCGGHGTPHGDHCDCDPGYMQDPTDPLNCIPQ